MMRFLFEFVRHLWLGRRQSPAPANRPPSRCENSYLWAEVLHDESQKKQDERESKKIAAFEDGEGEAERLARSVLTQELTTTPPAP